jgi:GDPmannose 4,6-dehydratase
MNVFCWDKSEKLMFNEKLIEHLGISPRLTEEEITTIHQNLAAAVQLRYEEVLFDIIKSLKNLGSNNLCLGGGSAYNGTANLLEGLRKSKYKDALIHICASSEVFGRVPKEKLPIDEECSFHPASPYAISKVGTDLIGRYYGEAYNMMVMTTRMFTHTGPRRGDVFHESTFAKQIAMIEHGLQDPKILVGNLDSLRTYADVRDAVDAYWTLLTVNPKSGSYYNIGGTYTCKVGDTLNYLISKSTVKNIEIVVDQSRLRPIDADLQLPDTTKFREMTGWEPKIHFNQTMDDLLEYWRDRVNKGRKFLNR